MKRQADHAGSSAPSRPIGTLAGVMLVAVLSLGLAASMLAGPGHAGNSNGRSESGSDNSDDGFAADDEVIGTLPALGDPDPDFLWDLLFGEEPPAFYIEGPAEELLRSIVSANASSHEGDSHENGAFGDGAFTTYEFVPGARAGEENLRVTFHGNLDVDLDASLLAVEDVRYGLALGMSFHVFGAGVVCQERVVSSTVLGANEAFELPLVALHQLQLLDRVEVLTSGGKGARSRLLIEEHGGVISLGQELQPSGRDSRR